MFTNLHSNIEQEQWKRTQSFTALTVAGTLSERCIENILLKGSVYFCILFFVCFYNLYAFDIVNDLIINMLN